MPVAKRKPKVSPIDREPPRTSDGKVGVNILKDLDLRSPLQYNLARHKFGSFLLERKGQYQFVFGFNTTGIHSSLDGDRLEYSFNKLSKGLGSLPIGETLTGHLRSKPDMSERLAHYQGFDTQFPPYRFLVDGEVGRLDELHRSGRRSPKTQHLYCTYTPSLSDTKGFAPAVLIEKLLGMWRKVSDPQDTIYRARVHEMLMDAYRKGYLLWLNTLEGQLGLSVTPLSCEEMWGSLWQRFNRSEPIPVANMVTVTEQGYTEAQTSRLSAKSVLFRERIPVADDAYVVNNGQYTKAMVLQDKPDEWPSTLEQVHYLWSRLIEGQSADVEIVFQISTANQDQIQKGVTNLAKSTNASSNTAADKGTLDLSADNAKKKAIDAANALMDGERAVTTSTVVLVSDSNLKRLEEQCATYALKFHRPAWMLVESEIAWSIWVQCLPISMQKLLASFIANRTVPYSNYEAPGVTNWVSTNFRNKPGGVELLALCGTPVYVNPVTDLYHVIISGYTRSGKSVFMSSIILQSLLAMIRAIVIDVPKDDGASTFKPICDALGDRAAYFDTQVECSNFLDLPDVRQFTKREQESRLGQYQSTILRILKVLLVDPEDPPELRRTTKNIVALTLNLMLKDGSIQARYAAAQVAGVGTPEWEQSPVLQDFIDFVARQYRDAEKDTLLYTAKELVISTLEGWQTTQVGKAMSSPSTISSDADLLVFALNDLDNNDDAEILMLSAMSAAKRNALSRDATTVIIDETPVMTRYDSIMTGVADWFGNGLGGGTRVTLAAQELISLSQTPQWSRIKGNCGVFMTGVVRSEIQEDMEQVLRYEPGTLTPNTLPAFETSRVNICSNWSVSIGGVAVQAQFFPSLRLLGMSANNKEQKAARKWFIENSDSWEEGIDRFIEHLLNYWKNGVLENEFLKEIEASDTINGVPDSPLLEPAAAR